MVESPNSELADFAIDVAEAAKVALGAVAMVAAQAGVFQELAVEAVLGE